MGAGNGQNRRMRSLHSTGDDALIFRQLERWCMRHPDPMQKRRVFSIFGLAHLGLSNDPEARKEVEGAMESFQQLLAIEDDPRVLTAAVITAARMRMPDVTAVLTEQLENTESKHVMEAIALAYGCLGAGVNRPELEQLSGDDNLVVREAATWALTQIPSEEDTERKLIQDFHGFLNQINPDDFARFSHYHSAEDDDE